MNNVMQYINHLEAEGFYKEANLTKKAFGLQLLNWLKRHYYNYKQRAKQQGELGPKLSPSTLPEGKEEEYEAEWQYEDAAAWNKGMKYLQYAEQLEKIDQQKELSEQQLKQQYQAVLEAAKIYKELATKSKVTGLPDINLQKLKEKGGELVEQQAKGEGKESARLFDSLNEAEYLYVIMDVDNLKWVNSQIGHTGANQALKIVGQILKEAFPHGLVMHNHGDEFSVEINLEGKADKERKQILQETHQAAQQASDKIRRTTMKATDKKTKEVTKIRLSITMGIGINPKKTDFMVDREKGGPGDIGKKPEDFLGKTWHTIKKYTPRGRKRPFHKERHVLIEDVLQPYLQQTR